MTVQLLTVITITIYKSMILFLSLFFLSSSLSSNIFHHVFECCLVSSPKCNCCLCSVFLIRSCQMKHNPLTVYKNVELLKITIWQIYTLQIWQISLLAGTHWNPQQMIGSLDSNMTWNTGLFKRCSVCPRVGKHHTYILQPGDCNTVKTDKHQKGLEWWIQV